MKSETINLIVLADRIRLDGNFFCIRMDGERPRKQFVSFIRFLDGQKEIIRADEDTLDEAIGKVCSMYFDAPQLRALPSDSSLLGAQNFPKIIGEMETIMKEGNIITLSFNGFSKSSPYRAFIYSFGRKDPIVSSSSSPAKAALAAITSFRK